MADEMSEALQAMEANEPQANLYRAADEYVSDQAYELMGFGDDDDFTKLAELMKQAVLYGAHWNEKQIMNNAIDGYIDQVEYPGSTLIQLSENPKDFNNGEDVKVIIIKK